MPLRCVLWDFGNTLADEQWMLEAPAGVPQWPAAWTAVAREELAEPWYRGDVGADAVFTAVAKRLSLAPEAVARHARQCCERIRFFETPLGIAHESRLPQAIVTVNPDVFSDWIVPHYALDQRFDPIVTSWEQGTLDKGEICQHALDRLSGAIAPADALLVDNGADCVEAWRSRGGRAYHYRGEAHFREDLTSELGDLAASAGWH